MKTQIVVIDYGAGNVKSVCNALDRLNALYEISGDPKVVAQAKKVIFPGVGAAGATMAVLRERGLDEAIRNLRVPVLGICLGMQLLFEKSEEGEAKGLGILPGVVKKFNAKQRLESVPIFGHRGSFAPAANARYASRQSSRVAGTKPIVAAELSKSVPRLFADVLTIPQIGWNLVKFADPKSLLIKNIPDESYFYFVHSYAVPLCDWTTGVAFYGQPFTAMLQKDNFFGTQFHPEKSGEVGRQLLANFLDL